MDYFQEARELVKNLNQQMNPSAYDIGWMARLKDESGGPRWPHLIDWLIENQKPDGSWGAEIEYYHDRIICTLSAILALKENGHSREAEEAVRRGTRYVWHHLHLLPRDPSDLVGFELIVPELLVQAQGLGLDVPMHTCGYSEIQTAKLSMIPTELLYSPRISTVHSLEFLGYSADVSMLEKAIFANGSLGNSPATTAYYLLLKGHDERAIKYLEFIRNNLGCIPVVYPFRTFELVWVLNNLSYCEIPVTEWVDEAVWTRLLSELGQDGVGADPEFGIPDGDTTSVCCKLLLSAGYDVPQKVLSKFEVPETRLFRTYQYERNISVTTNIHALEAIQLMPDYPSCRQVRDAISVMLLDNRVLKMYWTDKWHASPYYATSHAMIALLNERTFLAHACEHTIDWLVHTQFEDGSWGFYQKGTVEETAYILITLLNYHYHYKSLDKQVLRRAAAFLVENYDRGVYPALWIEKCLFTPHNIIRSAALSALILYNQIFGTVP